MSSINLIDSFQEFKDAENIDRPTLMKVIEDVFKTLIRKKYGTDENFDVIVNDQTGDLRERLLLRSMTGSKGVGSSRKSTAALGRFC